MTPLRARAPGARLIRGFLSERMLSRWIGAVARRGLQIFWPLWAKAT